MVLKWGLDRLSRPFSVQYNIDIEYFSCEISESAAAKRVEILRRSASRCPSLYRHRKRGKKHLDFTSFRSKMRFRVKYAGFYRESCGSMESRGRSHVMATQMRLLHICVADHPVEDPLCHVRWPWSTLYAISLWSVRSGCSNKSDILGIFRVVSS